MNNKKRIFEFLLISVLVLIGVGFVIGTTGTVAEPPFEAAGTNLSITGETGESPLNVNWTKGGAWEWVNITLNKSNILMLGGDTDNQYANVTAINVSVSGTVYDLASQAAVDDYSSGNISWVGHPAIFLFPGATCANSSTGVGSLNIGCWNTSNDGIINNSDGQVIITLRVNASFTAAEDTYTWTVSAFNGSDTATSTTFTTGIDDLAPRVTEINITDGTNVLEADVNGDLNGTAGGALFNGTNYTVTLTLVDENIASADDVYVYWSLNGSSIRSFTGGAQVNRTIMSQSTVATNTGTVQYNATLPSQDKGLNGNGSDGGIFSFVIVANDTYGHLRVLNQTTTLGYNFTVDGTTPTIAGTNGITFDKTSVYSSSSTGIVATCNGVSDTTEVTYSWELRTGSNTGTAKTINDANSATATFAGTEINSGGTYYAICKVTDAVGRQATTAGQDYTFQVTTRGSGGDDTGGSGGDTTPVDVDLTTDTEATVEALEAGDTKTVSIGGTSTYTITVEEVSEDTIKITIDDLELTLTVGEATEIDLNDDGENDVSVTLDGITDGKADLKVNKLAGAEDVVAEETTDTTEDTTTDTTTPEEDGSLLWLWIVIAVVIVGAGVWYFVMQKKGKQI